MSGAFFVFRHKALGGSKAWQGCAERRQCGDGIAVRARGCFGALDVQGTLRSVRGVV